MKKRWLQIEHHVGKNGTAKTDGFYLEIRFHAQKWWKLAASCLSVYPYPSCTEILVYFPYVLTHFLSLQSLKREATHSFHYMKGALKTEHTQKPILNSG